LPKALATYREPFYEAVVSDSQFPVATAYIPWGVSSHLARLISVSIPVPDLESVA
jgi:hypothetical protein